MVWNKVRMLDYAGERDRVACCLRRSRTSEGARRRQKAAYRKSPCDCAEQGIRNDASSQTCRCTHARHERLSAFRMEPPAGQPLRAQRVGSSEPSELDSRHVGVMVRGRLRRAVHFHRFRSRGREQQPDTIGTFLRLTFPSAIEGPLALGYACHFGLGVFRAIR